ncbi:uncharacterized protein [Haliotis asinina]|uniref:uncharacterized protein n=1 Tax=Haliotis asinina TaxID=109174 RepID=UPI0035318E03
MAAPMKQETIAADDLKSGILQKLEGNCFFQDVSDHLKCLDVSYDIDKENSKAASWLDWAVRIPYLKVIKSSVPVGILPNAYQGHLIDVKVFARHGPDDEIYDNNKSIREKVARGNCFLNIENGPHRGTTCVLYALKKFTGGLGDDDDREKGDNFTWKKYFTQPIESTSNVVATRKANGEAAHLSCMMIDGEYVLCGGSKNVHLLFRRKLDIKRYPEDRFRIAREVCTTVMDVLDQMEAIDRQRLLQFLCLSRYTAVFEILAPHHQHVEDLSHLPGPQLQFITWTSTDLEPPSDSQLSTLPPHVGIEIARALGLQTVEYELIAPTAVEKRMIEIRQGYNYEGEVLYFLDSSNCVIGLLKKKTIWYIICRATREKVRVACQLAKKNPDTFHISRSIQKLEKRMMEIQMWLGMDDDSVEKWRELAVRFLQWSIHELEADHICVNDISDKFPVLWKQHLSASNLTDKISTKWREPGGSDD